MEKLENMDGIGDSEVKLFFSFFGMVANSKHDYEKNINLEALGIQKEGEHSFYEWSLAQPPHSKVKLKTLLVGIRVLE